LALKLREGTETCLNLIDWQAHRSQASYERTLFRDMLDTFLDLSLHHRKFGLDAKQSRAIPNVPVIPGAISNFRMGKAETWQHNSC
jgi:hypothetical protein